MVGTFNPKYTYTKRGIYYFSKDVPADLRHHYTKLRIVQSLRTKSSTRAKHAAQSLVTRLEDYWFNLRLKEAQIPASHLLRQAPSKDRDLSIPTIVEALELYQRVKGEGRVKTFFSHSSRSINYLTECLGCRPLNQYSSADAGAYRDWLRNRELSNASVQRNFTIIKAVVNFTIQELGLECRNAFAGVYLAPDDNKTKRQPLSAGQIAVLQRNCYQAEAPTEVVDQLGGWSAQTIGQGYGNGHSLEMLTKWMVRMTRTASDLP
jgi:hypothetical protein